MIRIRDFFKIGLFVICFSLTSLLAHGVEVFEVLEPKVKVVRFAYSTDESMAYAKIKVYSPSNLEVIKSFTDRNGRFAFVPDQEGKWKIEAEDGMGHKGEIAISADKADMISLKSGDTPSVSIVFRILLALSLILNILALYTLFKKHSFKRV